MLMKLTDVITLGQVANTFQSKRITHRDLVRTETWKGNKMRFSLEKCRLIHLRKNNVKRDTQWRGKTGKRL